MAMDNHQFQEINHLLLAMAFFQTMLIYVTEVMYVYLESMPCKRYLSS